MNYGVKFLQYACLLLIALILGVALAEDANAILTGVAFILFVLNIKWISRYPVSFVGMYCINGVLTLLSVALTIKVFVAVAGTTSFSLVSGTFAFVIISAIVLFWWNVNVLELFRRRSKK